jgi:long-chain-fatty-acid--[acyl-carrier-protein] ligase
MIDWVGEKLAKLAVWLRYSVEFKGLKEVSERGREGIVFLPNHPSYIDPVIIYSYLHGEFDLHGFADQDQLERPVIGWFAKRWGVRGIPPVNKYGSEARARIEEVLNESIEGLKRGENLVLWPSGSLYKSRYEQVGANSSVEQILRGAGDVRLVLLRTRGLWGSSFSWGWGKEPKVGEVLQKGFFQLLANGFLFMPRRRVSVELVEPDDFPRDGSRDEINRYLEEFYNEGAERNHYVPYYFWRGSEEVVIDEPDLSRRRRGEVKVPEDISEAVKGYLQEASGVEDVRREHSLAGDLGMDSLARTDVVLWLEREFGFEQVDTDVLVSVEDVMAAACGEYVSANDVQIDEPGGRWFESSGREGRIRPADGDSIVESFVNQAKANRRAVVIADNISGMRTNEDVLRACFVLREKLSGMGGEHERVGVMLPAGVGASVVFMGCLCAGKTAVMVNWTIGSGNLKASLDELGVVKVVTSDRVVSRIERQGIDLEVIREKFVFIEKILVEVTSWDKLKAAAGARFFADNLVQQLNGNRAADDTAVVLFTSGSETKPKAVPLSHKNLLSNLRDVLDVIEFDYSDRLVGILPPFHSFGLMGTVLSALCAGAGTVYYANPLDSGTIAEIVRVYGVSVLMGTPGFIEGIARAGGEGQLEGLLTIVTGAEKCSERVYELLGRVCPEAEVLEGYGVTECSPIITVNPSGGARKYSIGKLLDGVEHILLDPETNEVRDKEGRGLVAVTGPNVFEGYLNYESASSFVEFDGRRYYNTGDIVSVDEDGYFYFEDRLKRFIKLAGEMVSLGAIEAVLERHYGGEEDPAVAVESGSEGERPEVVLFTTKEISRQDANEKIRAAGFSGLYNVRRVERVDEIPVLGTGKKDYKSLRERLGGGGSND